MLLDYDEVFTHGDCPECGAPDEPLTRTDDGLICGRCKYRDDGNGTYAPSLHDDDEVDEQMAEAAENIDEFEDELPDIEFAVEFRDGSTHEIDKWKSTAILMECGEDNVEEFLETFREQVHQHYDDKTEPSKFGTCSWGGSNHDESQSEYEQVADLAPVVLYPNIRSAVMQLAFIAMSGDDDPVTVVSLGEDGRQSVYGEHGKVTIEYEDSPE